jgi:hypothetical protein
MLGDSDNKNARREDTNDGFEKIMATNYLGKFISNCSTTSVKPGKLSQDTLA